MSETFITDALETRRGVNSAESQAACSRASLSFFFVLLFTLAIYARPEDIFPSLAQFHLTFLLGVCAGLAFLGSCLFGETRVSWTREMSIMLVLTCWFVIGVPFAYWRGGSFQVLTQVWLKTAVIFFLLTQTLATLGRIRKILWAIILSELAVCAYSILQASTGRWVGERFSGVSLGILGWNFLGIAAALTIPYIAALYIAQPSFIKTSLLAASVLSVMWMLVLTASRSGTMSVLFSIALTFLFVLRGNRRGKVIGLATVLILVVAISAAPAVFWQRMGTVWGDANDPPGQIAASARLSEEDRAGALGRAIGYTMQNPVFGLGLGNLMVASGTELARPEAWLGAHNTFAEISSEAGIPALGLFVALLWVTVRSMKRLSRTLNGSAENLELKLMARATFVSLLSSVFGAFFAHIGYEYFLYYPIAVGVGLQQIDRTAHRAPAAAIEPFTSSLEESAMDWSA